MLKTGPLMSFPGKKLGQQWHVAQLQLHEETPRGVTKLYGGQYWLVAGSEIIAAGCSCEKLHIWNKKYGLPYIAWPVAYGDAGGCGMVMVTSPPPLCCLICHQESISPAPRPPPCRPALSPVYIWECCMIIGLLAQFTMLLSYLKTRLRFIRCEG